MSLKLLIAFLIFQVGFLAGELIAMYVARTKQHELAVKATAAEYYFDSSNNRQFRYKTK